MQGKSCVLIVIPIVFSIPRHARPVLCICGYFNCLSVPRYTKEALCICGYSNCLFCPKTRKANPMYLWLFQLSFLSKDTPGKSCVLIAIPIVFSVPRLTRINAIPIVFSVPRHARQVLCVYIATSILCPFVFSVPTVFSVPRHARQVLYIYIATSILCPFVFFVPIVFSVPRYAR